MVYWSVVVELVMWAKLREVRLVEMEMGSATVFAAQEKVEGGKASTRQPEAEAEAGAEAGCDRIFLLTCPLGASSAKR